MIISNCPRCHEEFRVPEGDVPEDVSAICPWCRETFPITEVLSQLPPTLKLVTSDGLVLGQGQVGSAPSRGLQLIDSAEPPVVHPPSSEDLGLEMDESAIEVQAGDLQWADADSSDAGWEESRSDASWEGSDAAVVQSMNVSTKGNGRGKRKGSGIGTLIGIVLGGLMSIPIAGALLMLLGRTPDWGFWPFTGEGASSAVRAAPLPSLSSRSEPAPPFVDDVSGSFATGVSRSQDGDTSESDAAEGQEAGFTRLDVAPLDATPLDDAGLDDAGLDDGGLDDGGLDDGGAPADDPARVAAAEILRSASSGSAVSVAESREPAEAMEPSEFNGSQAEPSTAVSASRITRSMTQSRAEELAARAIQMIEALSKSEVGESEQKRRLMLTYQTIASATGLMDQDDHPLEQLADQIINSPLRDQFGSTGWEWLESNQRPSSGMVLIGRVIGMEEVQLLTSDSGATIELLITSPLPEDQELLVLGHVDDQGKYLRVVHSRLLR